MEFPDELMVRIEDTDAEPIFDAPARQDLGSLSEMWDDGTRVGIYKLVGVRHLVCKKEAQLV